MGGTFDEGYSKLRKFHDQVFVDGTLRTRLLHGPSTYEAWLGSWSVFKSAMIMMDAACLNPLNAYQEGMRQIARVV